MGRLLVIVGPTAVGKSKVAFQVAREMDGEIISADSVQVYRGLTIGSAKPSAAERAMVPHHMLDIADASDNYTVADFQRDARDAVAHVQQRGKLPILAGGTGLYITAVIRDYAFSESGQNEAIRERLKADAQKYGSVYLHQKLSEIDPHSAERIHCNDLRRIIRALEVYEQSKEPISDQVRKTTGIAIYDMLLVVLTMPREQLYSRIDERVDQMMRQGLVEEVKTILASGVSASAKAMQSLGYRQISSYLQGELSLERAVELIKRDTRRYAKRQLTWFRREPDLIWLDLVKEGGESMTAKKICALLAGNYQFRKK
jgi:tRNA dimethylallyltransferase